ncbi:uncharacterized protein A4U43_C05F19090 [Asparagus officinalis]|uniref:Uncharacterized protein n=1 Tax=Asparagus officinalis TaxID=4686 RepID=A0A5P1EX40_ASPOF|nr:uncharacterized protein A4U43_C05F19090 [Asparagus officinalis]
MSHAAASGFLATEVTEISVAPLVRANKKDKYYGHGQRVHVARRGQRVPGHGGDGDQRGPLGAGKEPDFEMRTRRSSGKRAPMSPWRASTGGGRRSGRGRGRRGFGRAGLADAGEEDGGGGGGEDGLGLAKDLLL